LDADDTQGLVLHPVQADLKRSDLTIQPVLALNIGRPAVKKVSDLEFLQATNSLEPAPVNNEHASRTAKLMWAENTHTRLKP
jgi:hypothetical protein